LLFVVGLYEAKTTQTLSSKLPKCRRQAILEFLAANQMRHTRK